MPVSQTADATSQYPESGTTDLTQKARIDRFDALSKALDSKFRIPGLGVPVGWDSILGLVPGVGALVTLGPGAAMIAETARMGGRKRTMLRMAGNTALDVVLGAVPVIGDVFDVFFKSHRRNVALLKAEFARIHPSRPAPTKSRI